MAKRRYNGEGTISQRKTGTWQARISYVDPLTGQRKRASVDGPTSAAVQAKVKELRERLDAGKPVKDTNRTVADWLTRWCETTLAVSDRKESTKALYTTLARKHLQAAPFGNITLDKLRATDVEALILSLRAKKLADSTVRQVYTVLRLALSGAVRDGLVGVNVAATVDRPGIERREAKCLSDTDLTLVLRAAESSRYYVALLLIAETGLRRGEALALRWDTRVLNLDEGWLRVEKTIGRIGKRLVTSEPKSVRSRRTVPLSAAMVAELKKHKANQAAEKLRAGSQWTNSGLVFTTEVGRAVEPRNLLRVIEAAVSKAGEKDEELAARLEGVGVHTLRHSAATDWLENGTHIKAVADLLGHSSISVTGDIYGHPSQAAARAAIDGRASRLGL